MRLPRSRVSGRPATIGATVPAETIEQKAGRYLADGRLLVEHVDDGRVEALCGGDHGVYELKVDRDGAVCSCPASGRCAHLVALELVTNRGGAL